MHIDLVAFTCQYFFLTALTSSVFIFACAPCSMSKVESLLSDMICRLSPSSELRRKTSNIMPTA
jgi:hypothetical protein